MCVRARDERSAKLQSIQTQQARAPTSAETRTTTSGPAVAEAATSTGPDSPLACRAVVRSQPPVQPVGQTGFDTTTVCLKAQKQRACANENWERAEVSQSQNYQGPGPVNDGD